MSDELLPLQEQVMQTIEDKQQVLIELASELIGYDTTAREPTDPPRDEARLQRALKSRLQSIGAHVDLWEPEPTGCGSRFLPANLDFKGRPQLAARLSGVGGGKSLLLLGHIDAVPAEPTTLWHSGPFRAETRAGRLYGRGSVDMKGGIAAMLLALEAIRDTGVRLAGDVTFCTVTDEESSGAGGLAAVERGVRADAGICPEPTNFDVWTACRAGLFATVTIEGRSGHAELKQPHWRDGGAANAVEKLSILLQAVERLREEWRTRADQQHPLLSPGNIVATRVVGGEWPVSYPALCRLTCMVDYLPNQVDDEGTSRKVKREVEEFVNRAASSDPWLCAHPLGWEWDSGVGPAEMPQDHPLVTTVLRASEAIGRPGTIAGFDSWHDGATFTLLGSTPTLCFGPGQTEIAHTIDEYVPVRDLIDCSKSIALAVMNWCGQS